MAVKGHFQIPPAKKFFMKRESRRQNARTYGETYVLREQIRIMCFMRSSEKKRYFKSFVKTGRSSAASFPIHQRAGGTAQESPLIQHYREFLLSGDNNTSISPCLDRPLSLLDRLAFHSPVSSAKRGAHVGPACD